MVCERKNMKKKKVKAKRLSRFRISLHSFAAGLEPMGFDVFIETSESIKRVLGASTLHFWYKRAWAMIAGMDAPRIIRVNFSTEKCFRIIRVDLT